MASERQRQRIVVIDDDPDLLGLVLKMLAADYEVSGTGDPHQAIALIREKQPNLIILDLMMPEIDGWSIYNILQADKDTQHIPVIILTAKVGNIDKVLGLQIAKVAGYLNKPIARSELLDEVHKVLQDT